MAHKPMSPATVAVVLSMVEGWSTKARIVGLIGSYEGGAWITAGEVAHWTGRKESHIRRLLKELADAKVILRDGGDGGRVFWCEVNPKVAEWRGVPWTVTPRTLLDRLAHHGGQVAAGPVERFIARPKYARCATVIARFLDARSDIADPTTSRVQGTRDDGGGGGGASRVPRRAMREHLQLVHGRAMSKAAAPGGVSPGGDGSVPPPSPGAKVDQEEEGAPTHTEMATARRAVLRRTMEATGGRKFINGPPLHELKRLVGIHGLPAVVAATIKVEARIYQPPHFIELLADVLDADATQLPADEPIDVDARLATIDELITTYEVLEMPAEVEKLRLERASLAGWEAAEGGAL